MAILLCLRWWYRAGWRWVWRRMIIDRFISVGDMFSMRAMAQTLFAPYRQTFTGSVRGGIEAQFRGMIDNLISRVIGFLVRSCLLITGAVACMFILGLGLGILALWAFIPLMPLLGVVFFSVGLLT